MLEPIIQFFNDCAHVLYYWMRKWIDYSSIKKASVALDARTNDYVLEKLSQRGITIHENYTCLITGKKDEWTFLIINEKNRLNQQIVINNRELGQLEFLDKEKIYRCLIGAGDSVRGNLVKE